MVTGKLMEQLRRDRYLDVKTKSIEPGFQTDAHAHLFDTRLLVLEGAATITCGASQRTYRAGDVIQIGRDVEHFQRYRTTLFGFVVGLRHSP